VQTAASDPVRLALDEAEELATRALVASRTSAANALATARALVSAEADGQPGHGLSRVPSYAIQSRAAKVDGFATPALERISGSSVRVDGHFGFAYPATALAIESLIPMARESGIACAAIHRSHHFGQAGLHAERLAEAGLVALVFGNSPKAMAFWGGRKATLGTNPIAFAAPLPDGAAPLVVDLALSVAARGKIVAAEKAGKAIPGDWAVDAEGKSTTDASAALKGTLLPIGGAKGGALALMVEILAAALTGSAFGWEASSFFDDKGGPPNMGHLFLALDPARLSGGRYPERMTELMRAIAAEPEVRLPGTRRLENRARAAREGLKITASLHAEINALIANPA
jgi:(2R)-3-sulfolactate dehydrogenase (NADP+)